MVVTRAVALAVIVLLGCASKPAASTRPTSPEVKPPAPLLEEPPPTNVDDSARASQHSSASLAGVRDKPGLPSRRQSLIQVTFSNVLHAYETRFVELADEEGIQNGS